MAVSNRYTLYDKIGVGVNEIFPAKVPKMAEIQDGRQIPNFLYYAVST